MKKFKNIVIQAILAGIMVGIAGFMYCKIEDKTIGAILFTFALFMVVYFDLYLFTGKDGYLLENQPSYIYILVLTWFGNLIGTWLVAALTNLTRMSVQPVALTYTLARVNDNYLSLFILGVFCNLLMFLAVDGFKNIKSDMGKNICLFLGISIFVVCGFEHCVADMFYIGASGLINQETILILMVVTLGNIVGSLLIPTARKWMQK